MFCGIHNYKRVKQLSHLGIANKKYAQLCEPFIFNKKIKSSLRKKVTSEQDTVKSFIYQTFKKDIWGFRYPKQGIKRTTSNRYRSNSNIEFQNMSHADRSSWIVNIDIFFRLLNAAKLYN